MRWKRFSGIFQSYKSTPSGFIYLVLFLIAFIPRTLALDAYVAPDEGKWIYRSAHFLQALLEGDLARMTSVAATPDVEVLAPAVPTMWTGALGLVAKYWTDGSHRSGSLSDYLETIPGQTEKIPLHFYPWTRFPTVLLTSLSISLFYFLLSKLMKQEGALLATLLLALDPFFIGLSRVIHHDALVSIFIVISLLSLLVYRRGNKFWLWLLLSGMAGGLALLTKPTALYLVVFVGLFLLLEKGVPCCRYDWSRIIVEGMIWAAVAFVTIVACWPALWVAPLETLRALLERSAKAIGDNNDYALIPAPGAPLPELGVLFYPVNWLFKTTLPVMIGLVALGISWWRGLGVTIWTIKWLTVFSLLFLLLLIPADTRDIRYFLPAVPILYALSAEGILILIARLRAMFSPATVAVPPDPQGTDTQHAARGTQLEIRIQVFRLLRYFWGSRMLKRQRLAWFRRQKTWFLFPCRVVNHTLAIGLLLAVQLSLTVIYFPYFVDYWNPVVGGPWLAPYLVKVGSGEGLDQMGHYLSQKPDAHELTVATSFWESFVPFFSGRYTKAHYDDEADYILIYRRQIQNRNPFPEYWTYFSARRPEYKVSLVGLDYAWLYPGPQLRVVRDADFGDGLVLRGYRLERPAVQPGQTAHLTLVWAGATPAHAHKEVVVQLIDTTGQLWTQASGSLLDANGPSPVEGHYALAIPAHMPRNDYELWVSVQAAGQAAEIVHQAGMIPVRYLDKPPVQFPASVNFGDLITFGGADVSHQTVLPGQPIEIKFLWQVRQPVPESYTTFAHVVDQAGNIWGQADRIPHIADQVLPTPAWEKREWIGDTFQLSLNPDIPPGHYTLIAGLYNARSLERLPVIDQGQHQTAVEITSLTVPFEEDK